MHVSQILSAKGTDVFSIAPEATVTQLVESLTEHRVGALLVTASGGDVVGIVSERDVVRALATNADAAHESVASIMTSSVVTVSADADAAEVMRLMTDRRFRHLPVLDESGQLTGLISIGDVVKNRIDELEAERSALMEYITQGG